MTAKEKAEELVNKFIDLEYPHPTWSNIKETCSYSYEMAKECALICVDEMIKLNGEYYLQNKDSKVDYSYYCKVNGELFEVKQEIEKL